MIVEVKVRVLVIVLVLMLVLMLVLVLVLVLVLGQLKDVFVLFFYLVLLAFCLYYSGTMIKLIDYYKALIIDLSALSFWEGSFEVASATLDLSFRGSHVLTNHGLTVWTSDVKVW